MASSRHTPPVPPASKSAGAPAEGDDWDLLFAQPDAVAEDPLTLLPEESVVSDAEPTPLAERYLGFRLGSERYAVPIARLSEVVRLQTITPVPRVQPFVQGILSVRGVIVPVVDLRRRLAAPTEDNPPGPLPADREPRLARVLITRQAGETFGLLVDEVLHPFRLEASEVEQPPQTLPRRLLEFVEGLGRQDGHIYILLDLDVVLRFDALRHGEAAGEK